MVGQREKSEVDCEKMKRNGIEQRILGFCVRIVNKKIHDRTKGKR